MEYATYKEIKDLIYSDPRESVKYCQRIGLIQQGDDGPSCGNANCTVPKMILKTIKQLIGVWYCLGFVQKPKRKLVLCASKVSVRTNTFFARSKLELWQILQFVWFCSSRHIDLIDIGPIVNMSRKTLVDWASFCQEVVFEASILNGIKLGGPDKVVEIDESKFTKRMYHRGHNVEGSWVFGAYERGSGKIFMLPVAFRSKAYLLPIIKHWIELGTMIISDLWKSYNCLEDDGFKHLTVNHSINFVDPNTGAHTNAIESSWKHAKETAITEGRKRAALHGNLAKYMFWNFRKSQNKEFFLEFCVLSGSLYNGLPNNERLTVPHATYLELQDELAQVTREEERLLAERAGPSIESETSDLNWKT